MKPGLRPNGPRLQRGSSEVCEFFAPLAQKKGMNTDFTIILMTYKFGASRKLLKGIVFAFCIFIMHSALAQVAPMNPTFDAERHLQETRDENRFVRKAKRYDRNSWRSTYYVYMKDGSVLEANSKIFKDKTSGKHFLYYSGNDSVSKIFPDQTIKVIKQHPYYELSKVPITGVPLDSCWRFQLIKGKINGYSFLFENAKLNEFQLSNGEILSMDPKQLEPLLINNKKAYKAFLKTEYYRAICIYDGIGPYYVVP